MFNSEYYVEYTQIPLDIHIPYLYRQILDRKEGGTYILNFQTAQLCLSIHSIYLLANSEDEG